MAGNNNDNDNVLHTVAERDRELESSFITSESVDGMVLKLGELLDRVAEVGCDLK